MSEDEKQQQNQAATGHQPIFFLPGIITALCGLMIAIHVASIVLDGEGLRQLTLWFAFIPLRFEAGFNDPSDWLPLLWTPVTHAFLHASWEHLLFNVVWLAIFGTPVARRYGPVLTVALFLLAAVAGAAAFAATDYIFGPAFGAGGLIGASGGIAGLTGAAVRFIFQPVLMTRDPVTDQPVIVGRRLATVREVFVNARSRWFTLIWIVLNAAVPLLPILTGTADVIVAWQSHLGGFLAGFFLVPLFERRS